MREILVGLSNILLPNFIKDPHTSAKACGHKLRVSFCLSWHLGIILLELFQQMNEVLFRLYLPNILSHLNIVAIFSLKSFIYLVVTFIIIIFIRFKLIFIPLVGCPLWDNLSFEHPQYMSYVFGLDVIFQLFLKVLIICRIPFVKWLTQIIWKHSPSWIPQMCFFMHC